MEYCVNITLNFCNTLIDYCKSYCYDSNKNCICNCITDKTNFDELCVEPTTNETINKIIVTIFMANTALLLLICCYQIYFKRNNNSIQNNNNNIVQDNTNLPKYEEIIDIDDDTPLPLPQYHQQPPPYQPNRPANQSII